MRLRWQLLLVSLLTLALPWAGWRYTVAVERAQRADRQAGLMENAALVERILSARLERLPDPLLETQGRDPNHELSARRLTRTVLIDGFVDEWAPLASTTTGAQGTRWQAGLDDRFLYLYVEADDASPRYRSAPGAGDADHDALILIFDAPDGARTYARIDTPSPGPVSARHLRDDDVLPRIRGFWRAGPDGHAIEVRLPLDMVGDRFGFAVLDADEAGSYARLTGTLDGDLDAMPRPATVSAWRSVQPGLLIRPATRVNDLLGQLRRPGQRLSVVDSAGWRVASAGQLSDLLAAERYAIDGTTEPTNVPLAEALLRFLLRQEDEAMPVVQTDLPRPSLVSLDETLGGSPAGMRYRVAGGEDRTVVLSAAHPMRGRNDEVLGAVLIEQSTDTYLTLNTPAFSGLMQTTVLASLIAAIGLLAYATVLSLRIARLRNAAERAAEGVMRPGAVLSPRMPLTRAGDELGDLARSFQVLLERLREQTDYLKTLAQKLSHELRTPLTIVQSSLENLDSEQDGETQEYLTRAAAGTRRLGAILKAMSEATRLEQSLESVEFERFDLRALVTGMHAGYGAAYPQATIELRLPSGGAQSPLDGAPELIAQLLDKLVDNAVSFSPPDRPIGLTLEEDADEYRLIVRNEGPPLPQDMQARLFDSMVSVREGGSRRTDDEREDGSPHLGLGLYVVRLVAQLHGGRVEASNTERPAGVKFTCTLPRVLVRSGTQRAVNG
ncbi:MAG: ATP-binding protein [Pseudomonadota bacterium]